MTFIIISRNSDIAAYTLTFLFSLSIDYHWKDISLLNTVENIHPLQPDTLPCLRATAERFASCLNVLCDLFIAVFWCSLQYFLFHHLPVLPLHSVSTGLPFPHFFDPPPRSSYCFAVRFVPGKVCRHAFFWLSRTVSERLRPSTYHRMVHDRVMSQSAPAHWTMPRAVSKAQFEKRERKKR